MALVLLVCRALGFGEGVALGATPASGVALGAAVLLRGPGALAAAAGFALAGLASGLPPALTALDAAAHGLAALLGAAAMRHLARRRRVRTRTSDWLIFLAGIVVFTATVALGFALGALIGWLPPGPAPWLAAVFEPFGILTLGAVLASLDEVRAVRANLRPTVVTAALGVGLLLLLSLLLALPVPAVSPSGVTLIVALPFCLWVAMQRRSLDGAALSFLAGHVALLLLLADSGAIGERHYVTAVVYLNLLVANCQLVHAVNRDRLAVKAELKAHKAELEARVAERTARLSAMTERALAADAAKTLFLATVSHEVRTPLSGVLGMASVVLKGDLDPVARRQVEIIRTSGFHLLDVINRILDFSRRDQPPRPEDLTDFDLRTLLGEVLDEARFLPYSEGLAFAAELDPGLAPGRRGYRQGLRQILTNLVGNAAKFTDRGAVTVRVLGRPGDTVRLEVEDTGIGIPPEARERIFEPFEQADGSITRRHAGTGLGLAICAEVVARLGGRIGVDSAPGSGSLFWVELPLPPADLSVDRKLDQPARA